MCRGESSRDAMPGILEGTAGGQWWCGVRVCGVRVSKIGGNYPADPEAANGGAAVGKHAVYAGRGCGRGVPGRGPRGLGAPGGEPHDRGASLTHTQFHRKGQRCKWLYGSAGGGGGKGGGYRQRCRQSRPRYRRERKQKWVKQGLEGGLAMGDNRGTMKGQWHTGHGKHVSKHGTAGGCQKRQVGSQGYREGPGKFQAVLLKAGRVNSERQIKEETRTGHPSMVKATRLDARTSLECGGGMKIAGDTARQGKGISGRAQV
jgi:hypothetical protein